MVLLFFIPQVNLSSLPSPLVRDAILKTVLLKLRPELQHFSSQRWAGWFQQQLPLLLPSLNKTHLAWLGTNISCASYQATWVYRDSMCVTMTALQLKVSVSAESSAFWISKMEGLSSDSLTVLFISWNQTQNHKAGTARRSSRALDLLVTVGKLWASPTHSKTFFYSYKRNY